MSTTCPSCRHVVEVSPGDKAKCTNCGAMVASPPVRKDKVDPPDSDEANAVGPSPASPPTTPYGLPLPPRLATAGYPSATSTGDTRAASIVAFVLGLLFFIPVVTQLMGIVAAAIALLRPRKENERVFLAWIGLSLCVVTLPCWVLIFNSFTGALTSTGGVVSVGYVGNPYAGSGLDNEPNDTDQYVEQMERVHAAASAYHRDFRKWPPRLSVMLGSSLPNGFELLEQLTFRPVPKSKAGGFDWILMVSDPVKYNLSGDAISAPHRLVLRLSGKVELLPSGEVEALLAESSPDEQSSAEQDP